MHSVILVVIGLIIGALGGGVAVWIFRGPIQAEETKLGSAVANEAKKL